MRILRLLSLPLWPCMAWAQPATIMTWNLLSFSENSADRVPHYRTVIDSMRPEILVVQEVEGPEAANYFHQQVLTGSMAMAAFVDGPDSDNALFYDSLVFATVAMQAIPTNLRNIGWFTLSHRFHYKGR